MLILVAACTRRARRRLSPREDETRIDVVCRWLSADKDRATATHTPVAHAFVNNSGDDDNDDDDDDDDDDDRVLPIARMMPFLYERLSEAMASQSRECASLSNLIEEVEEDRAIGEASASTRVKCSSMIYQQSLISDSPIVHDFISYPLVAEYCTHLKQRNTMYVSTRE